MDGILPVGMWAESVIPAHFTATVASRIDSQKSLSQVARVKILCSQRQTVPPFDGDLDEKGKAHLGWPEVRNPPYGIIITRHVRLQHGAPILDDPKEILRHLLTAKAKTLLAPDFCVFGKNNMFIPVVPSDQGTVMPSPFFLSGISKMNASLVDGVGFGAGLSLLLWALDWIHLGAMSWPAILEDCVPPSAIPLE